MRVGIHNPLWRLDLASLGLAFTSLTSCLPASSKLTMGRLRSARFISLQSAHLIIILQRCLIKPVSSFPMCILSKVVGIADGEYIRSQR